LRGKKKFSEVIEEVQVKTRILGPKKDNTGRRKNQAARAHAGKVDQSNSADARDKVRCFKKRSRQWERKKEGDSKAGATWRLNCAERNHERNSKRRIRNYLGGWGGEFRVVGNSTKKKKGEGSAVPACQDRRRGTRAINLVDAEGGGGLTAQEFEMQWLKRR